VNCLSFADSRIPQMCKAFFETEDELQQLDITKSPSSKIPSPYFELNDNPSVSVRCSMFIKIGYHSNLLFNVAEIAFIRSDWQKLGCSGFSLGHGEGTMEKSPLSLVSLYANGSCRALDSYRVVTVSRIPNQYHQKAFRSFC